MAKRRCFNIDFFNYDNFTDLPISTRLVYFYLCLSADDDGFFGKSAKHTIMLAGGSTDDVELLIEKGFIIRFESGIMVITDWWLHNIKQNDRFTPTDYINEFSMLGMNQQKAYFIKDGQEDSVIDYLNDGQEEEITEQSVSDGSIIDSHKLSREVEEYQRREAQRKKSQGNT